MSYGSLILRSVILRETGLTYISIGKQIKELKENGLIEVCSIHRTCILRGLQRVVTLNRGGCLLAKADRTL